MAERKRLRRPDPARTGPIRDGAHYLRDSQSWGSAAPQAEGAASNGSGPGETMEDVVTQGVKLGYKVIDEYLRQGQRVAERLCRAANGTGDDSHKQRDGNGNLESSVDDLLDRVRRSYKDLGGEMEDMLERTIHLYKDMWAVWMDGVELVLRSPLFVSGFAGTENGYRHPPPRDGSSRADASSTPPPIVEISSKRPARVALRLTPRSGPFEPRVHALHAADPAIRPLTEVSVRLEPDTVVPIVQVRIPDDQPPGTYTGAVVDRESNAPQGTLSVSVLS